MSDETPLTPEAEARFKALAGCVPAETWDKLISATTERMLRQVAFTGALDQATPEQLAQAHQVLGTVLVEFTNVALTCVAQGETRTGA